MWTSIKSAIRRVDERAKRRREYEFLLQQNSEQIFNDIGVTRAEVERLHRKASLI